MTLGAPRSSLQHGRGAFGKVRPQSGAVAESKKWALGKRKADKYDLWDEQTTDKMEKAKAGRLVYRPRRGTRHRDLQKKTPQLITLFALSNLQMARGKLMEVGCLGMTVSKLRKTPEVSKWQGNSYTIFNFRLALGQMKNDDLLLLAVVSYSNPSWFYYMSIF